ncbi:MAG: dihydroorotate dehydrogenase electron transfer subunit [Anaerolineae bacterium]|nr:dihydroorotate dehydrogenase electron transfer subunit [Anaerolineae bacterium]
MKTSLFPLPNPLKITKIKKENASTKTFILDGKLNAQPGQFVMAWLPDHEDKPFSLANANPLSLTIADVGPLSHALHQLQVGDTIWVRGPLGKGYTLPTPASGKTPHVLLIGGGYGVAPLLFLAKQALSRDYQVSMVIGARKEADLLLVNDFKTIGTSLWLTTEDGSTGIRGLVTDALPPLLAQATIRPTTVCTCGPTGMLRAVAAVCATENIPVQVSWEAHMRCGIGLCGSCEVGEGWLTCLDGPVFPFDPVMVSPHTVLT